MTLQQLRYVTVIAETGSLNKASEVLYVSQPSHMPLFVGRGFLRDGCGHGG